IVSRVYQETSGRRSARNDVQKCRIIVNHHNMLTRTVNRGICNSHVRIDGSGSATDGGRQLDWQGQVNNKRRALAQLTFYIDGAAHHFTQLTGNGEAKATALKFACGAAVGLLEGFKDLLLLFRR